jgi:Tfp pilus assembly protein PilF
MPAASASTESHEDKPCDGLLDGKSQAKGHSRSAAVLTKDAQRYLEEGDERAAVRALCSALEYDPSYRTAHHMLALSYLRDSKPELAEAVSKLALKHGRDSETLLLMADAHSAQGKLSTSLKYALEGLDLDAADTRGRRQWTRHLAKQAQTATRRRQFNRAARLYARAFVLSPGSTGIALEASHAALISGDPEQARRWARRALRLDAGNRNAKRLMKLADNAQQRDGDQ